MELYCAGCRTAKDVASRQEAVEDVKSSEYEFTLDQPDAPNTEPHSHLNKSE